MTDSNTDLAKLSYTLLDDGKAEDIVSIDLTKQSSIADTMIIATGNSSRHVAALASKLKDTLAEKGIKNIRIEGIEQADWVILDAGDVIVHLFRQEVREFYNLERMWNHSVAAVKMRKEKELSAV